jgi:dihydropyrimidinase
MAISGDDFEAKQILDCQNKKIIPGLIDPHVHFDLDLGDIKSVDDFESGGALGAMGGVTCILDFLAPITNNEALNHVLELRLKQASKCPIDYGFHLTLGNYKDDLKALIKDYKKKGLYGIKVFMTYEDSDRMISYEMLEALSQEPLLVLVHGEANHLVDPFHDSISTYESSRPLACELEAFEVLNTLFSNSPAKLYIVHTTSGSGVLKVRDNDNIYLETCPQYLYFNKTVFSREEGGLYLLAPAFRSEEERLKLIDLLEDVDTIATDHCSFLKADKVKSSKASQVPKGLGTLPYSFLLAYNKIGFKAIDKMCKNVADIFGLKTKGGIEVGKDADFFIFDENQYTTLKAVGKSDYSVYEGLRLKGRIESTYLRGRQVYNPLKAIDHKGKYIKAGVYESHH